MLFTLNELCHQTTMANANSLVLYPQKDNYLFLSTQEIKHLKSSIGDIQEGLVIPFTTKKAFTMLNLIAYCLPYCPNAVFYGTTWGLSQKAAECLVKFKTDGLLKEIHFLFDHRIKTNKPKPLEFLKQNADTHGFSKAHAKIASLQNDNLGIAIVASMNYTDNPRFEAGVIIVTKQAAAFFATQIQKEICHTAQNN
jgi:ATP-dependent RNA circularization protein (DNA/RNA ligase family)